MAAEPRVTMRDYCKRYDTEQVSLGFQPAEPVNFDIKGNVLAALKENQFDGRANKDPWLMQKVPNGINEGHKKLRLFTFSLTGTAKEWLQCLPSGTIQAWKELEDKFIWRDSSLMTSSRKERRTL
ncbi:hypothetical protein L195_g020132 [Trifolium pratense]|uniref:Retrotransposon gag domain-containing protein n=1 Tax=Trifolium pratense TaxID=57577 RepID=A0A2K3N1I6_TRIPR|nr:hypothetical protein L195_g020132 [Trifolium pratense]